MSQHTATRQTLIAWLDAKVDTALTIDVVQLAETVTLAQVGASPADQAELELLSERLLARVESLMHKASPAIALDCAKVLATLTSATTAAAFGRNEAPLRLTSAAAA